jgi:hypothetical protein
MIPVTDKKIDEVIDLLKDILFALQVLDAKTKNETGVDFNKGIWNEKKSK